MRPISNDDIIILRACVEESGPVSWQGSSTTWKRAASVLNPGNEKRIRHGGAFAPPFPASYLEWLRRTIGDVLVDIGVRSA